MSNEPMTALVEFQINADTTSAEDWLEEWGRRADDAQEAEPQTTSYAAAINLEEESNVLVFERYSAGDASLKEHSKRHAHVELQTSMGEKNMTKRRVMGSRFSDIEGYGWWSRSESSSLMKQPGIILTVLGMRFKNEQERGVFIELSQGHADYCWREEPDTLIYSAGVAMSDSDRGPDIKAGDLIFVMGCTDQEAVDKHQNDENHLALGDQFVAAGITIEGPFLRRYRTTGDGFLWK